MFIIICWSPKCTWSTYIFLAFHLAISQSRHPHVDTGESNGADWFITSQMTHLMFPSPRLFPSFSMIYHDNWIRCRLWGQTAPREQGDGERKIQSSRSSFTSEAASAASCRCWTQHAHKETTGQACHRHIQPNAIYGSAAGKKNDRKESSWIDSFCPGQSFLVSFLACWSPSPWPQFLSHIWDLAHRFAYFRRSQIILKLKLCAF